MSVDIRYYLVRCGGRGITTEPLDRRGVEWRWKHKCPAVELFSGTCGSDTSPSHHT